MVLLKNGLIFYARIPGDGFESFLIKDIFYYIFRIVCLLLHKADFLMAIVAEESDMVHEALVLSPIQKLY